MLDLRRCGYEVATFAELFDRLDGAVVSQARVAHELLHQPGGNAIWNPHRARQIEIAVQLFEAMGIERDDKALNLSSQKLPYVILVVGVNGVGKTTTIGKLAKWLKEGDWDVVIAAADTFRAAAVDQIATWADRAGATLIRPKAEGQDPASVAFEATEVAVRDQADILIIDTAGRLQNKVDLMNELDKIRRVVEKQAVIAEVLLIIDATTGQNGMVQA